MRLGSLLVFSRIVHRLRLRKQLRQFVVPLLGLFQSLEHGVTLSVRWGLPISFRSEDAEAAGAFAETLARAFTQAVARSTAGPVVRVLGPAECPVFKLKDFFRFHFQVQCESSGRLHEVLREVLASAKPPHGVEFQVDVDPYSMV